MKKVLLAAAVLALTTTAAHATYQCQPTYYQRYDNYYHTYIVVRGRDNCIYYPDAVPEQPYIPVEPGYYPEQGGYYEGGDAGAALVGGLIGFGLGYAVGDNHHSNKNNYYYYNGHRNKHYKYPGGWNNGQGRPQPKRPPQPNND